VSLVALLAVLETTAVTEVEAVVVVMVVVVEVVVAVAVVAEVEVAVVVAAQTGTTINKKMRQNLWAVILLQRASPILLNSLRRQPQTA